MDPEKIKEIALKALIYMLKDDVMSAKSIQERVDELIGKLPGVSKNELLEFGVEMGLMVLEERKANVKSLIEK